LAPLVGETRSGRRTTAENLDYLFWNLSLNGFDDVEVFPLGLAERPGLCRLFGGSTGASLVKGWADATGAYCSTIATNKLDTLLRHHAEDRLLIKMDVEGGEFRVSGACKPRAESSSQMASGICLTEHQCPDGINPHFEDVFSFFGSMTIIVHS